MTTGLLKVTLYLSEELLSDSDEVLGQAAVALIRGQHQYAKERLADLPYAQPGPALLHPFERCPADGRCACQGNPICHRHLPWGMCPLTEDQHPRATA